MNPAVVHVSPRVQARGGIESLHALHRKMAGDHAFVALFDRNPEARDGYVNLDCSWRTPLAEMRRRFARAMAPYAGRLVLYHNGWGLPLFHDLDQAGRRAVMLHADPAYHAPDLPSFRGLVDGALVITPALARAVTGVLPELGDGRTDYFRVPIEQPPAEPPKRPAPGNRPWVLGYAGRIERPQKRLDRLPALLEVLHRHGVDFRFELIGTGDYHARLAAQVGDRVRFHGWVSREEYWQVIARWDAMVFFSDNEGGPIALLEGMAAGALPFYPACGGSWADEHLPVVNPAGHYPPGDMAALAHALAGVLGRPEAQVEAMRAAARASVAMHRAADYAAACTAFFRTLASRPRISALRRRDFRAADLLPLGLVTRLAPGALRKG